MPNTFLTVNYIFLSHPFWLGKKCRKNQDWQDWCVVAAPLESFLLSGSSGCCCELSVASQHRQKTERAF